MFKNMTGAILSGGENKRFPIIKGFIKIDNERIIERGVKLLKKYFSNVIISTNNPEIYFYLGIPMFGDVVNQRGPVAGLLTCLLNADNENIFVMACDMPFVKKEIIELIVSYSDGHDAIVPVYNSQTQPLLAIYNKRITPVIKDLLKNNKRSLRTLLNNINVKYINEQDIVSIDREGVSFKNINTLEDIEGINAKLK